MINHKTYGKILLIENQIVNYVNPRVSRLYHVSHMQFNGHCPLPWDTNWITLITNLYPSSAKEQPPPPPPPHGSELDFKVFAISKNTPSRRQGKVCSHPPPLPNLFLDVLNNFLFFLCLKYYRQQVGERSLGQKWDFSISARSRYFPGNFIFPCKVIFDF